MTSLLYLAFFLSGVAGLVYETIWSRYLALMVGHGAYAQVLVLSVFLGGLALGAMWVGSRTGRITRPLRAYAWIEIGVGGFGLLFHEIFLVVRGVTEAQLFPMAGEGVGLLLVRWGISIALLLPPSFLLGTTFPLITGGFLRIRASEPGRSLSVFYFLNSFGAALGALLTGFLLIGWFGLPGTTAVAGLLNLTAGGLALFVARAVEREADSPSPSPHPAGGVKSSADDGATQGLYGTDQIWRTLLFVAFGTAVASFIYEIAWIRMLSLVLGSATHAFELMLSAFILGLAIGAWIIRAKADRLPDPLRTLSWIQWTMGAAALLTLPVYLSSFAWTEWLLGALDPTDAGYRIYNLARYAMALAVMLPATILAGTTLPLITMILLRGGHGERSVGWVYGVNTLGSILGVSLAALVLLPMIGLKALLVLGAALDMLLGVWLMWRMRSVRGGTTRGDSSAPAVGATLGLRTPSRLLAGTLGLVALVVWASPFELTVLGSGVFRSGLASGARGVLFWEDGRTASVGVLDYRDQRILSTNGKPDASLSFRWLARDTVQSQGPLAYDESTQALISMVTLAHGPSPERVLVIGHGSGMSSHFMLGLDGVGEVVTAEIEPQMIEGSRAYYPANARVFDDPRSRFVLTDARALMAADSRRWDLILSEPSNPWVSGVSNLFTTEFYQQVADRLEPGGIFGQWLQVYEMSDDLLLSVLSAMYPAFSDFRVFRVYAGDVLVVATNEDRLPTPDWRVFDAPAIVEDLSITYPMSPGYLDRTGFLNRAALAPLLESWPTMNSDFYPRLDLGAERARYLERTAEGLAAASQQGFDPSDAFEPIRPDLLITGPNPMTEIPALEGAELAARLANDNPPESGSSLERRYGIAMALQREFDSILTAEEAPEDWVRFTRLVLDLEELRAGGRSGWVDAEFHERVLSYAEAVDAPLPVGAAIRFRAGLRGRRWTDVIGELEVLLDPSALQQEWMHPDLLLDGAVMSLLLTGDPATARRAYDLLLPRSDRRVEDLRSRILAAWLERQESLLEAAGGD